MISRNFIFTLNNPVVDNLPAQWFADGNVTYVTWQKEVGENGTPHLQGYFRTKVNPRNKNGFSLKWCKENLHSTMHLEKRMGSHEEAVDYVNKEETRVAGPWSLGEYDGGEQTRTVAPTKKNKANLDEVKVLIDRGVTDDELWQSHFSIMTRHHKVFNAYRLSLRDKERKWHTRCLVLYGPPKTGKSRLAQQIGDAQGGAFWLRKPKNGGTDWWDGYNGQKVVVIDEFYGWLPFDMLCRMLDRYPYSVETKGSVIPFLAHLVIFTSNVAPRSWYTNEAVDDDRWKAFVRRMSGVEGTVRLMNTPLLDEDMEQGTAFEDLVENIANGECDVFGNVADILTNDSGEVEGDTDEFEDVDGGWVERRRNAIDLTGDDDDDGDAFDHGNTSGGEYEETSQPYDAAEYEEERGVKPTTSQLIDDVANGTAWLHRPRQYELAIEKQEDDRWGKGPVQSTLKWKTSLKRARDDDDDFDDK